MKQPINEIKRMQQLAGVPLNENEEINNTLGDEVWEYELSISDPESIEEEEENIHNLKTLEDVKNYYINERGWLDNESLTRELLDLMISLAKKFPNL